MKDFGCTYLRSIAAALVWALPGIGLSYPLCLRLTAGTMGATGRNVDIAYQSVLNIWRFGCVARNVGGSKLSHRLARVGGSQLFIPYILAAYHSF